MRPNVCLYLLRFACAHIHYRLASQVSWYRMENGPKAKKMGKNWPKNSPWPEMGKKMAPKGHKMEFGLILLVSRHFLAFFSPCRAVGHFLFFGHLFPISGFRPIFRSMPGHLTRNCCHTPSIIDTLGQEAYTVQRKPAPQGGTREERTGQERPDLLRSPDMARPGISTKNTEKYPSGRNPGTQKKCLTYRTNAQNAHSWCLGGIFFAIFGVFGE